LDVQIYAHTTENSGCLSDSEQSFYQAIVEQSAGMHSVNLEPQFVTDAFDWIRAELTGEPTNYFQIVDDATASGGPAIFEMPSSLIFGSYYHPTLLDLGRCYEWPTYVFNDPPFVVSSGPGIPIQGTTNLVQSIFNHGVAPVTCVNGIHFDMTGGGHDGFPWTTIFQEITINELDSTPPLIIPPADITVEATGPQTEVSLGNASADDEVDGMLNATPDVVGPFAVGVHAINWTATDNAGNIGSAFQIVTNDCS